MKRLFILLSSLVLLLVACAKEDSNPTRPEPTQPTSTPTAPSVQPTEPKILWDEYSDYELMELTLKSDVIDFRMASSYFFEDQEWLLYMMENCEPFKELMFRETALESLERYSPELVTKHRDDKGLKQFAFAELVSILIPEMKVSLDLHLYPPEIIDTMSWIVPEAYNNFLRAMNRSPQAALRYLHFEDPEAEAAFLNESIVIKDGNITMQGMLNETLYVVAARLYTEQNPEGQEVTHFVGCIDDRWMVMMSADQIPAELKDGLDLSKYE